MSKYSRDISLSKKKKIPTSYCNFPIVKCLFSGWQFGDSLEEEKTHWRKVRQLWRKPLCTKIYIFLYIWGILSEDTSESAKCKEIKQMQLVKLCGISDRPFEETFENPLWRKVKLMQPMWLWAGQGRGFEDTFENTLHHIFIKAPFGGPIQFWQTRLPFYLCPNISHIFFIRAPQLIHIQISQIYFWETKWTSIDSYQPSCYRIIFQTIWEGKGTS